MVLSKNLTNVETGNTTQGCLSKWVNGRFGVVGLDKVGKIHVGARNHTQTCRSRWTNGGLGGCRWRQSRQDRLLGLETKPRVVCQGELVKACTFCVTASTTGVAVAHRPCFFCLLFFSTYPSHTYLCSVSSYPHSSVFLPLCTRVMAE